MTHQEKHAIRVSLAGTVLAFALALPACVAQSAETTSQSASALPAVVEGSASAVPADSSSPAGEAVSAAAPADSEPRWTSPAGGSDSADERQALREGAQAQGLQVFEGSVRILSGTELAELEGVDPSLAGDEEMLRSSRYAILVLDAPQEIAGAQGDGGSHSAVADHIGLGQAIGAYDFVEDTATLWAPYEGKRVCVAGEPWYGTDVSLPMAPRMTMGQLLYHDA